MQLEKGKEDPVASLPAKHEDTIERIDNLAQLHVTGTFANTPGSRLAQRGPRTTFVYAGFAHWKPYWILVWNKDDTLRINYSGSWLTFILAYREGSKHGCQGRSALEYREIRFEGDC